MSAWTALMPAALMGTGRTPQWQASAAQAADGGDALQAVLVAVLAQDSGADTAPVLLRAAGVVALGERIAAPLGTAPPDLPAAPAESRPALDDARWLGRLHWAWAEAPERAVQETALALQAQGWRLPARLLPLALARATREPALRAPLAAVLGERGHWLARQHPQWQGVTRAPALPTLEHWAHGSLEARAAFLRHERGSAPAAARERLVGELPQQGARERSDLVAALAVGLSMDDAALLETLLATDRSREVRVQAALLLSRLPGSAHVRYLTAQLAALLQGPGPWRIEPPEREDPGWKAHAIEPQRPRHEALGERAWWLYQLVRQVPPGWWCDHLQSNPAELLAAAGQSPWSAALLRGWRDALLSAAGAPHDWAQALLDAWDPAVLGHDSAAVQALLPLVLREPRWQRQLGNNTAALLYDIGSACAPGDCLSASFGAALAGVIRRDLLAPGGPGHAASARAAVLDAVALLPRSALAVLRGLSAPDEATPSQREVLVQVGHLVELRLALPDLPNPSTSSAATSS